MVKVSIAAGLEGGRVTDYDRLGCINCAEYS